MPFFLALLSWPTVNESIWKERHFWMDSFVRWINYIKGLIKTVTFYTSFLFIQKSFKTILLKRPVLFMVLTTKSQPKQFHLDHYQLHSLVSVTTKQSRKPISCPKRIDSFSSCGFCWPVMQSFKLDYPAEAEGSSSDLNQFSNTCFSFFSPTQ